MFTANIGLDWMESGRLPEKFEVTLLYELLWKTGTGKSEPPRIQASIYMEKAMAFRFVPICVCIDYTITQRAWRLYVSWFAVFPRTRPAESWDR